MLSVVVPYHSNRDGLAVTLVGLQSQLVPPDRIVVVDTSRDRSGQDLARRYATPGVPMVVECAEVPIYAAWNRGIALAGPEADVLVVNDDLLLPQNAIDVLTMVTAQMPGLVFVPRTPAKGHHGAGVAAPFAWYAPLIPATASAAWMPGFCFLLTRACIDLVGRFDERFRVWYGDDDYERRVRAAGAAYRIPPIVRVDNLFVHHYGGSSYDYADAETRRVIAEDRAYFRQKHHDRG